MVLAAFKRGCLPLVIVMTSTILCFFVSSHWLNKMVFLETKKIFSVEEQERIHRQFHQDSHNLIASLVNASTILMWASSDFEPFLRLFNYDDLHDHNDANISMPVWLDPTERIVYEQNLCRASQHFKAAGSVKKHVLISHLNENWGGLSSTVPNRTVDFGELDFHWKKIGCTRGDVMTYLNHANTMAVFTTQHQAFYHPKVYSIPLGVAEENNATTLKMVQNRSVNRTQLLMLNANSSPTRKSQIEAVLKNFNGTGLSNTYNQKGDSRNYYIELMRSKFIMCPSGMGWDTYHMWESFTMGIIPVLERYNRVDGWHRTMDDLPIVWVESFENDLTPVLLEREYQRIASSGASRYMYEKLTTPYWKDFIESFLTPTTRIKEGVGGKATDLPTPNIDLKIRAPTTRKKEEKATNLPTPTIDLKVKSYLYSRNFKNLPICNTQKLVFNVSAMVGKIDDPAYIVYDHRSKLGYGPTITKTGSTSTKQELNKILGYPADIARNTNEEALEKYVFFSILRHPMKRALAGFHQVEVFLMMNWYGAQIDKIGLKWWNQSCIDLSDSTWVNTDTDHLCLGSEPQSDDMTRIGRLVAFLDDIVTFGFHDQHVMPMTYQISVSPLFTKLKTEWQPRFFDIDSLNDVIGNLSKAVGVTYSKSPPTMKRIDYPWVVRWEELTKWASLESNDTNGNRSILAKSAIRKLCTLYQNDVNCLPYNVPECEESWAL